MYTGILPVDVNVYVCVCVCVRAHIWYLQSQKRCQMLRLELQMVVSHHVGDRQEQPVLPTAKLSVLLSSFTLQCGGFNLLLTTSELCV